MTERPIVRHWKCRVLGNRYRGFESPSLRFSLFLSGFRTFLPPFRRLAACKPIFPASFLPVNRMVNKPIVLPNPPAYNSCTAFLVNMVNAQGGNHGSQTPDDMADVHATLVQKVPRKNL